MMEAYRETGTQIMSTASLITVEQFARMRTSETEDYELVEGELIPLASGTPLHAAVRGRAEALIRAWFQRSPLGEIFAEVDCRLAGSTTRRPDLSIFLGAKAHAFDLNEIPVPFAPDIAVEVLSPSDGAIDVNRKALEYLAAGSQEVWLLDNANGEIFVQTPDGIRLLRGNAALTSPLLPGFAAAVSDLLLRNH
jgi:Uma2 family endonuclease